MGRDEDIHQCQYHNTMRGLLRWWRDKTLIVLRKNKNIASPLTSLLGSVNIGDMFGVLYEDRAPL